MDILTIASVIHIATMIHCPIWFVNRYRMHYDFTTVDMLLVAMSVLVPIAFYLTITVVSPKKSERTLLNKKR